MSARPGYRGPEVCKLVGITYRQLDYWARTDLVRPSVADAKGSGTQRRYSRDDVIRLRLVNTLLTSGISLVAARAALPWLDASIGSRWLIIGPDGPVVVDDNDNDGLLTALHRAGPNIVIDLGRIAEGITEPC